MFTVLALQIARSAIGHILNLVTIHSTICLTDPDWLSTQ